MHAEILSIGDEITSGQLLDTNSQWLSLRLEEEMSRASGILLPVKAHPLHWVGFCVA